MKWKTLLLFAVVSVAATTSLADKKPLLKHYRGDVVVPDELYDTFERLVEAFRKGDRKTIEKICLPRAVHISTAVRPRATAEFGGDINIPFVAQRFTQDVLNVMKQEEGVFLLRTGTSHLRFVETKQTGWRLYAYGDKPIQ